MFMCECVSILPSCFLVDNIPAKAPRLLLLQKSQIL